MKSFEIRCIQFSAIVKHGVKAGALSLSKLTRTSHQATWHNKRLHGSAGIFASDLKSNSDSADRAKQNSQWCTEKLTAKGLVKVSGSDAADFLQGMLTNDINCLLCCVEPELTVNLRAIYSMMLNVKGRVLHDLLVYSTPDDQESPEFLVEIERKSIPDFLSALKRYKIRRKVTLSDVSDELDTWAVYWPDPTSTAIDPPKLKTQSALICVADPRIKSMSYRFISPPGFSGKDLFVDPDDSATHGCLTYDGWRYSLGIGEGTLDHPVGDSLPLESNLVFLNGVSFQKGCYIGQELTARTYHTGVVRKRLMPIVLPSEDHGVSPGDSVVNEQGKNCGKVRGCVGCQGLALLRVTEVLPDNKLCIKNSAGDEVAGDVTASIPHWWPTESDSFLQQILSKAEEEGCTETPGQPVT